jgi:hypothetical protein
MTSIMSAECFRRMSFIWIFVSIVSDAGQLIVSTSRLLCGSLKGAKLVTNKLVSAC